jgi:hypothetical protein
MVKGTKEDVLRVTGMNKVEQKEEVITVPVIRYKNDGNSIAKNSITIKNYNNIKGFYISEKPFEVTNYATNYRVIFKLTYNGKTVYFEDGIYSLQAIESKVNQDFVNKVIEDSIQKLKDYSTLRHVSYLQIEVARELGLSIEPLIKLRSDYIKNREESDKEKEKIKNEERKEADQKREFENNQRLLKAEQNFANQLFIDGETIIELAKKHDVKIHIRTIGAIRKNNVSFKTMPDGNFSYNYSKRKGQRGYTLTDSDFLFELLEKIKSQPKANNNLALAKAKAKAIQIRLKLLKI